MNSAPALRWGILGTGWILRKYAEAFRLARNVQLVAVASRNDARARAAAAQFAIPRAHAGYDALLADPELDIVINALPNGLHSEWTIRALTAGKHVLCEKPLACSSAEVEQMFAAARRHQRWLMEAFMYRFHPQLPRILEHVRHGDIGRLLHLHSRRMSMGREPGNPRYDKTGGGGALFDIGCYCVDFSRAVANAEPQRVTAHAHFDRAAGVDLTLTGCLEFPGDVTAHLCCSFESEPSYGAEIIGTDGRLLIPHPWMPPMWPTEFTLVRAGQSETFRVESPAAPAHVLAPFALELEYFADCVRESRAPSVVTENDSRGNMRVIEALQVAARA